MTDKPPPRHLDLCECGTETLCTNRHVTGKTPGGLWIWTQPQLAETVRVKACNLCTDAWSGEKKHDEPK